MGIRENGYRLPVGFNLGAELRPLFAALRRRWGGPELDHRDERLWQWIGQYLQWNAPRHAERGGITRLLMAKDGHQARFLQPWPAIGGADQHRKTIWTLALLTGLLTSTFSTLVVTFGAGRIGRDIDLSWMEVGLVLLRDSGAQMHAGWREIAAGILVHQSADIFWALVFFGLGARWTLRIRPAPLLALALPWAAVTSFAEYYLILPWLQPLLRMQTPYWINLSVHISSAAAYPVFLWLRQLFIGGDKRAAVFGQWYTAVLVCFLGALGVLALLGGAGQEVSWPYATKSASAFEQRFMRQMAEHHRVGVVLAQLAAEKAEQEDLRTLGRLMVAEQEAEISALQNWWQSWYGGQLPPPTAEEHATMPGMPPPGAVDELARRSGASFEQRFLELMIPHHEGAIVMSDEAWRRAADPRVRLLADQIRHAQRGQIIRMAALRRDGFVEHE